MDRNVIGLSQQVIEFDFFTAAFPDLLGGQHGIIGQHPHVERRAAHPCQAATDISDAEHPNGAAVQFAPDISGTVNLLPGAGVTVRLHDPLRQ